jgi:hypothetical protein
MILNYHHRLAKILSQPKSTNNDHMVIPSCHHRIAKYKHVHVLFGVLDPQWVFQYGLKSGSRDPDPNLDQACCHS